MILFTFPQNGAARPCRDALIRRICLVAIATTLTVAPGWAVDWQRVQRVAIERYGSEGQQSAERWQTLLEVAAGLPIEEQLVQVNDFFNQQMRWTTDQELYGRSDYWATPLESLSASAGDCEDFSIGKYISLLALGIPPEQLRLVYVRATRPGLAAQAHMVLAWYQEASAVPLIMDNINTALLSADQRKDLVPVFSFNHTELWLGANERRADANPQARMARWQQVLRKIEQEGMTIND